MHMETCYYTNMASCCKYFVFNYKHSIIKILPFNHSCYKLQTLKFNCLPAYSIICRSGTTRPTYSATLGPFFTLPTTVPVTFTTPTASTTSSSEPTVASPSTGDDGSQDTSHTTVNPYTFTDAPLESGANTINHTMGTHMFRTLIIILITIIVYFGLLI